MKLAVVTFEKDFFARSYVAETALTWPLLVDDTRETYRNYGMLSASFWDIWGPKKWWAFYQRGGDVLIDLNGIVSLHHVGAGPDASRPECLETLRCVLQQIMQGVAPELMHHEPEKNSPGGGLPSEIQPPTVRRRSWDHGVNRCLHEAVPPGPMSDAGVVAKSSRIAASMKAIAAARVAGLPPCSCETSAQWS